MKGHKGSSIGVRESLELTQEELALVVSPNGGKPTKWSPEDSGYRGTSDEFEFECLPLNQEDLEANEEHQNNDQSHWKRDPRNSDTEENDDWANEEKLVDEPNAKQRQNNISNRDVFGKAIEDPPDWVWVKESHFTSEKRMHHLSMKFISLDDRERGWNQIADQSRGIKA